MRDEYDFTNAKKNPHAKDLLETLNLSSIPGMKEKITEGLETPLPECVPDDEVEW